MYGCAVKIGNNVVIGAGAVINGLPPPYAFSLSTCLFCDLILLVLPSRHCGHLCHHRCHSCTDAASLSSCCRRDGGGRRGGRRGRDPRRQGAAYAHHAAIHGDAAAIYGSGADIYRDDTAIYGGSATACARRVRRLGRRRRAEMHHGAGVCCVCVGGAGCGGEGRVRGAGGHR
eukprot:1461273-Rhodomonas_salina.2